MTTTTNMECNNCGYKWEYKGKLSRATCPNCLNKVKIGNNDTNPTREV